MKNRYETNGDITTIHVRCHLGTWHLCLIDTVDLPQLLAINVSWAAIPARKSTTKYYVIGKIKGKTVMMHRLLCGFPNYEVHHKDNNGLNNRKSTNLEQLVHQDNVRATQPDRDWLEHDRRAKLGDEYRLERVIAAEVQLRFGLTRQGLWKIRKGDTRRSDAAVAYHEVCASAGVRPYELLKRDHDCLGKFGAVRGRIIQPDVYVS